MGILNWRLVAVTNYLGSHIFIFKRVFDKSEIAKP